MNSSYEYGIEAIEDFEKGLRSSYIDSSIDSNTQLRPQFISNNEDSASNLLSVIKRQLADCTSFDFSVAFISDGGLQSLINTLNALREQKIPGRLLTSTYLNFNNPSALKKLLEYPNIETRIFEGAMHVKGYFFNKPELHTVIVGSSNLTQTALTCNQEWNVLFQSYETGAMLKSARHEFETLWNSGSTHPITSEWITHYELHRQTTQKPNVFIENSFTYSSIDNSSCLSKHSLQPNKMQEHALSALSELHDREERRALLISATGTGKTYLSAFDIYKTKPEKILFIAHRKRILEASEKSFRIVLGDSFSYEQYETTCDKTNATCIFAMVTSLSKHLHDFNPAEFDYIIIDEAHRSGADSYKSILNHFTPRFFLGMTATPSRTDGYDIYALFNHVIAYRITLQDALENEMLTPFHYFGIADLEIDDEIIDKPELFSMLTTSERVRHITSKIEEYSVADKKHRRGLIFCNRNEEALALSEKFNYLGYKTLALSGRNTDAERNRAIERLEQSDIEYIFTVDIFNEGIDIPSLNQVIMLRRTESPIVFIQQLGRGLRKMQNKEYTLVLDFIGNYQKNYFVPIALSGDRTYNKDNLRAFVKEGSTVIPGCSTISFDRISESRIFRALDKGKFNDKTLIRKEFATLKQILGRIPHLLDFDKNESIDPLKIFSAFGSYHALLIKEEGYTVKFSEEQSAILKHISKTIAHGKRFTDIVCLRTLIDKKEIELISLLKRLTYTTQENYSESEIQASLSFLAGYFSSADKALIEVVTNKATLHPLFAKDLQNVEFKNQVLELLDFASSRSKANYKTRYKNTAFTLYAKYTYEEVCRYLNWEKNVNGQNIGGYKHDKPTNTFPVFINYDKDPEISDSIKYEDRFISNDKLIAISKQPRKLESPEIILLRNQKENAVKAYLFVRKNKNDNEGSKEFYFLGEIFSTGQFKEIIMPGTTKKAVEIFYQLDKPVRADLYDYLTSDID